MSGGPASGGSNPRKFSEKIALHNQKQAEETRAFEQVMTELTVSRVQFQKVQQLRLSQSRTQFYGGSLPNVNQMCDTSAENQGFPAGLDSVRGTRHHGLVERVHRDRTRISSPHSHRRTDKHRHCENSPYGAVYLSPPPDNSWRRDQSSSWIEDKRPGLRLMSQLNRTNSDSALHTSVMNPEEAFGLTRAGPQRNPSVNEPEVDGDIFSFPPNEKNLIGVKPLPKQLWEAKKVQSLASRPKSCDVPGINIFSSPDQSMSLPQYQSCQDSGFGPGLGSSLNSVLNTGGSLPDLTSLHFPSPLSMPLDSEENYSNNLPHAMMHLGLSSSLSNPSLCTSPRRRPAPISPLTLSPEQRRGAPPTMSPISQSLPLDPSTVPREPPPPYPHYQQSLSAQSCNAPQQQQQQQVSPLQSPTNQAPQSHQNQADYSSSQNMAPLGSDPFMEQQYGRQYKSLPYQFDGYNFVDGGSGACSYDPSSSSSSSSLFYSPTLAPGQPNNNRRGCHHDASSSSSSMTPQGSTRNMFFSNAALPNIILTDDSVPDFSLEDELRIEPLSLDGLSMLSDPELVLPDPAVEDAFRSDRL